MAWSSDRDWQSAMDIGVGSTPSAAQGDAIALAKIDSQVCLGDIPYDWLFVVFGPAADRAPAYERAIASGQRDCFGRLGSRDSPDDCARHFYQIHSTARQKSSGKAFVADGRNGFVGLR